MIEGDESPCEVMSSRLTGEGITDDRAFASLAILSDRLERVRSIGGAFKKVSFSPAVKRLKNKQEAVAVG
jgi:hypothetical protein